MPVPPQDRQPKAQDIPSRQIKTGGDPESLDKETLAWHFHRLDNPHADWGWHQLQPVHWRNVLDHLIAFEGLTWAQLKQQAGGRNHGTNHHSLPISELAAGAKHRLSELHLDEFDSVFSLRISNTLRLYGVRNGRVLQLIWYDPHHGTRRGACPTR